MNKEEALAQLWEEAKAALGDKKPVFGEGSVNAKLVIVGEAPGREETRLGRPFVGNAGRLLNQLLQEVGLRREDVWITNVVKWWPIVDGGITRPPTAKEVEQGVEWLKRELEIINCNLILALGNVAARALVAKDFKMTTQRGQWFEGRWGHDVLVTFHPAYVLRQIGDDRERVLHLMRQDFQMVKTRYGEVTSRV